MGDADGNGHVDGNDFLLKGSNQRQQSADGPYGRGTRQNGILIGLLIP